MNRYLAGAVGGLLASVPMTLAMTGLFRRLPEDDQYPLPPREITDEVMRRAGYQGQLSEAQLTGLSLAAHFGYGGLTGALYPAVTDAVSSGQLRRHPGYQLVFGGVYGVAIWAGSYLGWIPALRILGSATVQPSPRRRLMVGVHLIWGATAVLICEQLVRQDRLTVQPRRRSESVGMLE